MTVCRGESSNVSTSRRFDASLITKDVLLACEGLCKAKRGKCATHHQFHCAEVVTDVDLGDDEERVLSEAETKEVVEHAYLNLYYECRDCGSARLFGTWAP